MPRKTDAIQLLKEDHKKVKELFDQFEDTEDKEEQGQIARKACQELTVHAELEEEMFYPEVRQATQDEEIMNEAEEEHHVAKMLIKELEAMEPDDEKFAAKFIVLAENVRHHIKEEEGEMIPKAKKTDVDFEDLGQRMMQRKQEVMAQQGEKEPAAAGGRSRHSAA